MSDNMSLFASTELIKQQEDVIEHCQNRLDFFNKRLKMQIDKWNPNATADKADYTSIDLGRRTLHDNYHGIKTEIWRWSEIDMREIDMRSRIYTRLRNMQHCIDAHKKIPRVTTWLHKDKAANAIQTFFPPITENGHRYIIHIQHASLRMYLKELDSPAEDPSNDKHNGYAGSWDPRTSAITRLFMRKYIEYIASSFHNPREFLGPHQYAEMLNSQEPLSLRYDFHTGKKLHPNIHSHSDERPAWTNTFNFGPDN